MVNQAVKLIGPIFAPGKPERVISEAQIEVVKELAKEGRTLVRKQLRPGHGFLTGELSRKIQARTIKRGRSAGTGSVNPTRKLRGRANWIESGRSHRPTRFRGFHVFKTGEEQLQRKAVRIANGRVKIAVRKLN